MWCWWFQRDLTALVDGELPWARAARVRFHVSHCPRCAALQVKIARCVAQQQRLLPFAGQIAGVDIERLLGGIRARLGEEPAPSRRWGLVPRLAVAATAAALAILVLLRALDSMLMAAGIADPPPVVAEKPDLFRDYTLFEHFDALEHFETVQAVPLEEPGAAPNG